MSVTPGGEAHDQAHRPCRIGLRQSKPRTGRGEQGGACELQEITAAKFRQRSGHDRFPFA
jgi:hypothetical protein